MTQKKSFFGVLFKVSGPDKGVTEVLVDEKSEGSFFFFCLFFKGFTDIRLEPEVEIHCFCHEGII
ncbi:MAG: hypothetical protein JW795_17435 [Chitinivibrionales bacterium]|nr:hypothetical protein [Chitinivibrionales bacterium]